MKKLFISVIFLIIFLFLPVVSSFADTAAPTLSDAVYADLALKGYLDNVSVSFYDGNSTHAININESRHWLPASTVKLFAAIYAFKLISDAKLSLYQNISVDSKNVVANEFASDEFPTIQEGDYLTVDRLLKQMITQSDNTAFNVLLDVIDRKAITEYIHSIGLTHSAIGSKLNLDTSQEQYEYDEPGYGINTTTADDYTKAFTLLWQDKISGAKSLVTILKQQKINYMLPLLLPKNVVVAHKHGDLDPLYHDGGIIFGPQSSYALSVFSNTGDPNIVAHLSDLIYSQDFNLVGKYSTNPSKNSVPDQNIPLDPLVAEGKPMSSSVLGISTQSLSTQPITAADLGITAKDLSLAKQNVSLPKVFIHADSPLHILVSSWQFIERNIALTPKAQAKIDMDTLLLKISEAKDLTSRGKIQQANTLFNSAQGSMNTLAKDETTKSDAQAQIKLQAVSESRFQILADTLNITTGSTRLGLIKEIGQQAKSTLTQVEPNIPLATNATNPTQRPLIGQVINKTDTEIVVKTAGGQQITIPFTDNSLKIKVKDETQPIPTAMPTATETLSPTLSPVPTEAPSLSSIQPGETIAMIGSTVGNTFTPTFVLKNVPKELAAPEPVVVVKVNQQNRSMVISENGVPVQVNVSDQTIIKGADTRVGFTTIKPGDVVIVHGSSLTPVAPVISSPSPTMITPVTSSFSKIKPTVTFPFAISATPAQNQNNSILQTSPTLSIASPIHMPNENLKPSVIPTFVCGGTCQLSPSNQIPTTNSSISKSPILSTPVQSSPSVQPQQQPQPKAINSTSIQIIEKAQDIKITPPTQQSTTEQLHPSPTQSSSSSQPTKSPSTPQQSTSNSQSKAPAPIQPPVSTIQNNIQEKK